MMLGGVDEYRTTTSITNYCRAQMMLGRGMDEYMTTTSITSYCRAYMMLGRGWTSTGQLQAGSPWINKV